MLSILPLSPSPVSLFLLLLYNSSVRKATGIGGRILSWREPILNHLDRDYTEPVRDTLWHNILLSEELKRITGEPEFQKLGRIKQLGPAFHVYPGATHTRLAHSFGVFHIAKLMIRKLITSHSCTALSVSGVKSFLLASLFHDVGHFPYAHSLKELPLKKHEALTGEFILDTPMKTIIEKLVGIDPFQVAAIVDTTLPIRDSKEIPFFRNILSGVLDPDKLDYLNRDAFFCGVPYGMQDIDYVVSKIVPHDAAGVAIVEQGINAVENVLFSKYLMYKTVYWHKTVRIATAMIKKAVQLALENRSVRKENLYGIDDKQFAALFTGLDKSISALVEGVTNRNLYKVAAEAAFRESNPNHIRLTNLENRRELEEELTQKLSEMVGEEVPNTAVIVDVPEPISFEVDLPISGSGGFTPFPEADSVFSSPVVSGFSESLRKLRLIMPRRLLEKIPAGDAGSLLP